MAKILTVSRKSHHPIETLISLGLTVNFACVVHKRYTEEQIDKDA